MSQEVVNAIWAMACAKAKTEIPGLGKTTAVIDAETVADYVYGTIKDDCDEFHVPTVLIAEDSMKNRALLHEIMLNAIYEWHDKEIYKDRQLVKKYLIFNTDIVFENFRDNDALKKEDEQWYNEVRAEDEAVKKINLGRANYLMQCARIIQQTAKVKLADGWRFMTHDYPALEEYSARMCPSINDGGYCVYFMLRFAMRYGAAQDGWRNYPIADMKRRDMSLFNLTLSDNTEIRETLKADVDYAKYLDDPAYKAATLISLTANIKKSLEKVKWFENEPTESSDSNGPFVKDETTVTDTMILNAHPGY